MNDSKGRVRESAVPLQTYFSKKMFETHQLCSLVQQITHINELQPRSLLEIGPGNGFVSTFLKRAGINVTTVDINEELEPDICSDIGQLPEKLTTTFDAVSCCEVLEHMPWEEFPKNIEILRKFSPKLFLTLPNNRYRFGFGGFMRLPRNKLIKVWLPFPLFKRKLQPMHFWELGSSHQTSISAVKKILSKHYSSIRHGSFELNPYHYYFSCE